MSTFAATHIDHTTEPATVTHTPYFDSVQRGAALFHAREIAIDLGRVNTFVSSDAITEEAGIRGISLAALGNAAGSVFSNRNLWKFTGQTTKSITESRRGAQIKVWEYIGPR